MSVTIGTLLAAAQEVAELAGAVAFRRFRGPLRVETKADDSPVTEADHAAEDAARGWIARRFPEDGIVGEENGTTHPEARRMWFVDPVDGTRAFVLGVPLWGSMIGVVEEGVVVAGAIAFPALRESLAAGRGEGCWWNGARCRVSDVHDLAAATALTTDSNFPGNARRHAVWTSLAKRVRLARSWGDCFGYLLVATGRAEIMVDDFVHPWDSVPLLPIIEEAGGVIADWSGGPAAFGDGVVATNGVLSATVRAILAPSKGEI